MNKAILKSAGESAFPCVRGWLWVVSLLTTAVFGVTAGNTQEPEIALGHETRESAGTYFHLYAEYQVGEAERLVFDLQVSCGKHTFENGRVVRGYLPALYAKKTASNSVVMLAIPRACDAIRFSETDKEFSASEMHASWELVLDGNFIPFTIWFEDAEDLTYGVGYALAESFENLSSPLKLIDARIEPSNEHAFSKWLQSDSGNLLEEYHIGPQFVTTDANQSYWAVFDPGKAIVPTKCYGVAVVSHYEKASLWLARRLFPGNGRRYWLALQDLPNTKAQGSPSKEELFPHSSDQFYGNSPSVEFQLGINFIRRKKIRKKNEYSVRFWSIDVPEYYPAIRSDAYPVAGKNSFQNNGLKITVELLPETRGLLACYSKFNPIEYGDANPQDLYEYYFGPNYQSKVKKFGRLVDLEIRDGGEPILFHAIPALSFLPHFLIADESAAEFVTFEFFGGGHVR
ncbi:hypothetical protein ABWH98_06235 [Labrenzia sp. ac12]